MPRTFWIRALAGIAIGLATAGSVQAGTASQHRTAYRLAARFRPAAHPRKTPVSKPWPRSVVYAAPTSRGEVNVYKGGNKPPRGAIYSFALDPGVANSLQVDKHRDLFLADTYSTWVFEYAPGTNKPMKSFPTSEPPDQIAVRDKTLYVFQSMTEGGDVSVQIYENGSTTATRSLTDGAMEYPDALAVDKAGNVFVAYDTTDLSSGVGEFVKGKMPMVPLTLDGVTLPLSMAIDSQGDLVIDNADDFSTSSLMIFPPGATSASATISGLPWFYQISFTADGKAFYAGDEGTDDADQAFQKYAYPTAKLIYSYTIGDAFAGVAGVAASPGVEVGEWGKQQTARR